VVSLGKNVTSAFYRYYLRAAYVQLEKDASNSELSSLLAAALPP
jgi:hypothetical protein